MVDIYFVDDGEMRAFLTQKVYMGREACEPPTRKRVLSPFSTGLGDSCLSSPSRGTQVS